MTHIETENRQRKNAAEMARIMAIITALWSGCFAFVLLWITTTTEITGYPLFAWVFAAWLAWVFAAVSFGEDRRSKSDGDCDYIDPMRISTLMLTAFGPLVMVFVWGSSRGLGSSSPQSRHLGLVVYVGMLIAAAVVAAIMASYSVKQTDATDNQIA